MHATVLFATLFLVWLLFLLYLFINSQVDIGNDCKYAYIIPKKKKMYIYKM